MNATCDIAYLDLSYTVFPAEVIYIELAFTFVLDFENPVFSGSLTG